MYRYIILVFITNILIINATPMKNSECGGSGFFNPLVEEKDTKGKKDSELFPNFALAGSDALAHLDLVKEQELKAFDSSSTKEEISDKKEAIKKHYDGLTKDLLLHFAGLDLLRETKP